MNSKGYQMVYCMFDLKKRKDKRKRRSAAQN